LSKIYTGAHTKYKWQCSNGHIWNASYTSIQQGSWCPQCNANDSGIKKRNSIKDCVKIAESHGGNFLSKVYITAFTLYDWKCSEGHVWKSNYNNVQQGKWCMTCGGTKAKTLEDCILVANKNEGRCLSTQYVNNEEQMLWKCKFEHTWYAKFQNIQQGKWCPKCKGRRIKEKWLEKYGVEHNMHNKAIALKNAKSNKKAYKILHWKTKEELICIASYEKAVVEYFNKNQIDFLWQPKIFKTPFKTTKGTTKTYRPDCYLSDRNLWVEIKGYMRKGAEQKWNWFHKEYPNSELWNEKILRKKEIL
jgi:hypothetical protein